MKQNINEVVYNLLNDSNYQQIIINEFKKNSGFFEHSIIKEYCKYSGTLDSKLVIELLDSYKQCNNKIKEIIPSILYYSDDKSITCEVFNKILHLKKKYCKELLFVLAHCKISFYQLEYINRLQMCDEAFCQLLYTYSFIDAFTTEDLIYFLKSNNKLKTNTIKLHIKYLLEKKESNICVEKVNVLKDYLSKL